MNCNTTHYRANSSSVPGDPTEPLRGISGFSALLAERYTGQLDAKADEYLQYLRTAASRMQSLITDLLAWSRMDTRAMPFTRCPSGEIASAAVANLRAAIEERGAHVTIGVLPELEGDPAQLLQLFQNLVGNAIKFNSSQPPRVWVSARRREQRVEFSVQDNGIGIEEKHASRLFKLFSRLHTVDRYPGTGIGLAVCKRIVERHGGRIWVEARAPHGSIFRFTLPAAPAVSVAA